MTDFSSLSAASSPVPLTEYNIQKFQFDDLERSIRKRESRMNSLIDEFAWNIARDMIMRISDKSSVTSGQRLCSGGDNCNCVTDSVGSLRDSTGTVFISEDSTVISLFRAEKCNTTVSRLSLLAVLFVNSM